MFDTLTHDERIALFYKLSDWAHRFYEVGHTLAAIALMDGDYNSIMWDRRERYIAARADLCDLTEELAAGLAA